MKTSEDILKFWFEECSPQQWWSKDVAFDQMILDRFGVLHRAAHQGELYAWRDSLKGRLAEILVLDQFSRNIYRDTPQSFASDPLALCLSQHAVLIDGHTHLSAAERSFLYMPHMHSESLLVHQDAVKLFSGEGMAEQNHQFELKHLAIIERFGRYPHRNIILGRTSTDAELVFLQEEGSSF